MKQGSKKGETGNLLMAVENTKVTVPKIKLPALHTCSFPLGVVGNVADCTQLVTLRGHSCSLKN